MTVFAAAIDAIYGDTNFGVAAEYWPANGDPKVDVRVITGRTPAQDNLLSTGAGRRGWQVQVRASEIAAPVEGDVIVMPDGPKFTVRSADVASSDDDGAVLDWTLDVDRRA